MPKHDKDLLKESLTVNDIENLLYELGAQNIIHNEEKQELITNTICHNDSDGSHKLFYYYDSEPVFRCYTECSCNMDIYELVRKNYALRNIELTFSDTVNWVAERSGKSFGFSFGVDIDDKKRESLREIDWLNRFNRKKIQYPKMEEYSDRILNVFEDYFHPSFLEDNIDKNAMKKFDIKFYSRENRIVIPHRSPKNGKIIGLRGRAQNEWEIDSYKYLPLTVQGKMYSFPSSQQLYGYWENQDTIKKTKKIILFESEKSVMQCEKYFPDNNFSVAIMGRNISQYQIDLILDSGVEEVQIAMDKEFKENGSIEEERDIDFLLKMARRLSPYVRVYVLFDDMNMIDYKSSPSDFGSKTLKEMMKNKKEVLNKE